MTIRTIHLFVTIPCMGTRLEGFLSTRCNSSDETATPHALYHNWSDAINSKPMIFTGNGHFSIGENYVRIRRYPIPYKSIILSCTFRQRNIFIVCLHWRKRAYIILWCENVLFDKLLKNKSVQFSHIYQDKFEISFCLRRWQFE